MTAVIEGNISVNWKDVHATWMGHTIGTCRYCGYIHTVEGVFTKDTTCPCCSGHYQEQFIK